MGKGHPVSWMYIGMRCGWPQPMTTISVGGERAERDSGVMEDAKVRRYSWQFCGSLSVFDDETRRAIGVHAPQKKCRINIIRTRRGPFSLSAYKLLNVCFFPSLSSTDRSAACSKSPLVGGLLLTLISPLKLPEGSLMAILLKEEPGSLPIVSIQRTRGTRVRVSSMAMMVGLERKKEREEIKEWNEERHEGAGTPETNACMSISTKSSGSSTVVTVHCYCSCSA